MSGVAWMVPAPWTRPEPVIVVCAYCDRMRDASGGRAARMRAT
jgi:hypothetical protein